MEQRPMFFFRPEHDEWDFVRDRGRICDAVLVPARYLAPYPKCHPLWGKPAERLAEAAHDGELPLSIDPDTAGLSSRGSSRYASAARLRETAGARAVQLPLTADQLADDRRRNAFVDAIAENQAGAWTLAAPYFDFRDLHDVRFSRNLQMLRRVVASAGTQEPCAFLQVTRHRFLQGVLTEVAPSVAATGVRLVFTRVRGLDAERASRDEVTAYLEAIDAISSCGMDVVPDCVGRLGPVLVAGGANGFSGGAHHFRRVAAPLLSAGGGGGGLPVAWEHADGRAEVPRHAVSFAQIKSCPIADCRAVTGRLDDLREHRLHVWCYRARLAAHQPDQLIAELNAGDDQNARVWASVLAERTRRSA